MQALADAEHGVIAEAVRFLSSVCHERQIRKPSLLAAARKVSHWCAAADSVVNCSASLCLSTLSITDTCRLTAFNVVAGGTCAFAACKCQCQSSSR